MTQAADIFPIESDQGRSLKQPGVPVGAGRFDPQRVRRDFPILSTRVHGKPLVYLDNGATTQKPRQVIDAVSNFYATSNANIHRGVYELSQRATEAYESARANVSRFINAAEPAEIIFTRGTTEGINLVASSFGRAFIRAGDEIIVTAMEHHSNIVPWQIAAETAGATLRAVPISDSGELDLDAYRKLLSKKTKIVAITHLSNALGTINDVGLVARLAHEVGAAVLVDGAQWVAHHPTDVQAIDADFYVFSSHKLFGPTGVGVLYGKRSWLDRMPPYQGGGDMIESVSFECTTYAPLPNKFEAGTPDISGVVGLSAAIDYVRQFDWAQLAAHELRLLQHCTKRLAEVPGLRLIGTAENKGSLVSFVLENPPIASLQVGLELDAAGIAIRTGHHCCQPVMRRMDVSATARASFALYNTIDEVDALADALHQIVARVSKKPAASPKDEGAQVVFPNAAAVSPAKAAEGLIDEFSVLEERDERNQYVLDLGARLPDTFALLKKATPRVVGCMSEVYLLARRSPDDRDALQFIADADAPIVRGLIAILQRLFSGQKANEILDFDIESFFRAIELDQFITSQRRNGLAGMIQRIRAAAKGLISPGTES